MRKKIAASFIAVLSAILLIVAVLSLTVTVNSTDSTTTAYGFHGEITIQLPAGIPAHPTSLRLIASEFNSSSTLGARDNLLVSLWIPAYNNYMPSALITTALPNATDHAKAVYNGTPIWNSPLMPNVINVTDNVLQVTKQGDILIVNLTTAQKITLPFDQVNNTQYQVFGNLTFTLPPLTLTFRPIGVGFNNQESVQFLPHPPLSGYSVSLTSIQSPAWVQVSIPQWIGNGLYEGTGHICNNLVERGTPPAI